MNQSLLKAFENQINAVEYLLENEVIGIKNRCPYCKCAITLNLNSFLYRCQKRLAEENVYFISYFIERYKYSNSQVTANKLFVFN